MSRVINYTFFLLLCLQGISCKKFLETKSIDTLSTPDSFEDLQALLDNPEMNLSANFTNTQSDEYYIDYTDWQALPENMHKGYVWESSLNNLEDWAAKYKSVFYANTVLSNLSSISSGTEPSKINLLKGSALFHRAINFYEVAQLYASQYDTTSPGSILGIPLRLTADFNQPSTRATLEQTYDQITRDLLEAAPLLPNVPLYKTRPSKQASFALLAKAFLQMGNYSKAKDYAESCLTIRNTLIDYNSLNPSDNYPFPVYKDNPEIIFYSRPGYPINANDAIAKIDSLLYQSFDADDLRKRIFFRDNGNGTYAFKGNYTAGSDLFNGLAIDEVYLIRAECLARMGNTAGAMKDLNTLLARRWNSTFTDYTASNAEEALNLILRERRKELIYRATRWADLKRLNKEPNRAELIRRKLNGEIFSLSPNDLKYALLIPREIMQASKLQQNPR
jgi:hypothetical protein